MSKENLDNKKRFEDITKDLVNKAEFRSSLVNSCNDMSKSEALEILSKVVKAGVDLEKIPPKMSPAKQRGK